MFDCTGRVALITGASGALGGTLARRLVAAGAGLALLDRHPERLRGALSEVDRQPERFALLEVDLSDGEGVASAVARTLERFGRIDHVFNIAGAFAAAESVEATGDEVWARLWDANFRSTLHVCRAVVPVLKRQGSGTIVNVASRAALAGDAGVAAYSVAKTAVLRLTESLAAEGKRRGVRVNCVLPGTIDTPANRQAMPGADFSTWVDPEALVDVLLFLSSPFARAVQGAALPVFGLG